MKILKLVVAIVLISALTACEKKKTVRSAKKDKKEIQSTGTFSKSGEKGRIIEEGSFFRRKIKISAKKDKVIVEDDSRNLTVETPDKKIDYSAIPPRTIARNIIDRNKLITWYPQWIYKGIGGPRIPATAISRDESVIVFVETLGKPEGPFSSRLVFLETFTWRFIKVIELKNEKITHIVFIPFTNNIACWAEKQKALKRPYRVIVVCAEDNSIRAVTKLVKRNIDFLEVGANGAKLYVKPEKSPEVFVLNPRDLSLEKKIKTTASGRAVAAVSDDASRLAVASSGIVEMFSLPSGVPCPETLRLPSGYMPDKIIFTGKGSKNSAVIKNGREAFFFKGNLRKKICEFSENLIFSWNEKEESFLAVEMKKKNSVKLYKLPELTGYKTFTPSKIKPRTRGAALFGGYIKRNKRFFVLDRQGNLMIFYIKGKRRWKKRLIFSPAK